MANLIDTIIKGTARVLGTVFAKKVQTDTLNAPTTSGGSTFGPGTNGQILKSNGTTMYWGAPDKATSASSADSVPWTGVTGKPSTFTPTIGTTATTAAAGNHTHTTSLATSTSTSQLTLASGGKYVLTSGGTTYVFTMPTAPTTLPANGGNADTVDNKHAADFATSTQGTNADNHRAATNNPHSVTKAQVGLGNVTNDAQVKRTEMGVASGVATLDTNGKVPSSQLPSYVDDVLEYTSKTGFPTTGETGKIYVATDTNLTYRWSGSAYVEISASLALGETSSTAYRGDRGKIAYDHSQTAHAPSDAQKNVQSDWNATSGDAFIKNKPTVITGGSQTSSSTADGGSNVYTFTKSDGTTSTLTVKNGSKGSKGDTGATGPQGPAGSNGTSVTVSKTEYQAGTSNTTAPTGTWSTTIPSVSAGNYLWTRITFSDSKVAYSVARQGTNGSNGTTPTISAAAGTNIGSVGTPSVSVSTSGTTTTFTFNYLKGAKGDKGDPGTNATTTAVATTSANGLMSAADKAKLDGIASQANKYSHPTGDGNLHVPATGTTNNGKVLTAGSTAGSLSWTTPLSIGTTSTTAAAGNHNHDSVYQAKGNYKTTQTAVSDPGANGTSLTFIATASQNTNGVISITKKTVSTMGGASSSANGTAGLVPAPSKGDEGKFLMGNGTWVTLVHATYDTSTTSTTDLNYVLS